VDYGQANRFHFDDPNRWVTVPSVPLLDEHEMTNEAGKPVATVDRAALEEIARNNNKRVYDTGDPATLILGHTSDDPRAEEKPAKGFVVNYQVKPFKRDETGRVIYAIHGDYKVRPQNKHLLEEYPRRSVELWWNKKELDPIAMLGGSSPERDLGVVIRYGRINHVSLDHTPKNGTRHSATSTDESVVRFTTRGRHTIESYTIERPRRYASQDRPGRPRPKNNAWRDNELRHRGDKDTGPDYEEFNEEESVDSGNVKPRVNDIANRRGKRFGIDPNDLKSDYQDDDDDKIKYAEGDHPFKDEAEEDEPDEDQYDPETLARMRAEMARNKANRDRAAGQANDNQSALEGRRDRRKPPPFSNFTRSGQMPRRYGMNGQYGPNRYEDGDMDTDDLHDTGDEGIPGEDEGPDSAESDPVLAKLFQSKQWKELTSQMSEIMQALQGGGAGDQPGGDAPGTDGMDAPGGDDGMGGEMPPPQQGYGDPGAGAAPGGPDGDGMEPEEDERRQHGQQPVQMTAGTTNMPGPSNTYTPGFNGTNGKRNKPYSRGQAVNRQTRTPDARYAALERSNRELRLKYAKSEAAAIVAGLEAEGILFGHTPQAHEKGKADDTAYITALLMQEGGDKEVDFQVNDVIRARYARKRADPATPATPGLARFSRPAQGSAGNGNPEADGEDFEDKLTDDKQIVEFADLQVGPRKMSRTDAAKFMAKKYGIR